MMKSLSIVTGQESSIRFLLQLQLKFCVSPFLHSLFCSAARKQKDKHEYNHFLILSSPEIAGLKNELMFMPRKDTEHKKSFS